MTTDPEPSARHESFAATCKVGNSPATKRFLPKDAKLSRRFLVRPVVDRVSRPKPSGHLSSCRKRARPNSAAAGGENAQQTGGGRGPSPMPGAHRQPAASAPLLGKGLPASPLKPHPRRRRPTPPSPHSALPTVLASPVTREAARPAERVTAAAGAHGRDGEHVAPRAAARCHWDEWVSPDHRAQGP